MIQVSKMIKVRIQGEIVNIDARFADVSALIQQHSDDSNDEILSFSENKVTTEIFEIIKTYYQNNSFQPQEIEIQTSIANQLFKNQMDRELILKYDPLNSDIVMKLYEAAVYLQLQALQKLCLARIFYAFTFDPSNEKAFTKLNAIPNLGPIQIKDIEVYENSLKQKN